MGESDGTSGSAASSGADSSPPGSFAGEAPRVDFYVLEEAAAGAAAEEGLLTPEAGVEEALIAG